MTQAPHATSGSRVGNGDGPYMLTLCALATPVSVRFPEDSPLRQFKFFMTRANEGNEAERLRLHMGYFTSLAETERWALALRARYPGATPELVPQSLLKRSNAGVPVLRAAISAATAGAVSLPPSVPTDSKALTDTQVLRILDGQGDPAVQAGTDESHAAIALVRPEDTTTLRALKESVAQGAPVSFAVQLMWSATDIDLATVPSLSIFRAYRLYKVSTTREGRPWHCLRLGFFKDALSAKQVAYYVRSHFTSIAVVPVSELEQTTSANCLVNPATLSDDFQRAIDQALTVDRPQESLPAKTKASSPAPSRKAGKDSLDQTLEMLAASEMWNDPDSHTETGVRHLKFEIRKTSS